MSLSCASASPSSTAPPTPSPVRARTVNNQEDQDVGSEVSALPSASPEHGSASPPPIENDQVAQHLGQSSTAGLTTTADGFYVVTQHSQFRPELPIKPGNADSVDAVMLQVFQLNEETTLTGCSQWRGIFSQLSEATRWVNRIRRTVNIAPENDDWRAVWSDFVSWTKWIYLAMIRLPRNSSDWLARQFTALEERNYNQERYEAQAMVLLVTVIDIHANGVRIDPPADMAANVSSDNGITCSQRLICIINLIRENKRLVIDVMEGTRSKLDAFVTAPRHVASRKKSNMVNNLNKSIMLAKGRENTAKIEADAPGERIDSTRRSYKKLHAAKDDEGDPTVKAFDRSPEYELSPGRTTNYGPGCLDAQTPRYAPAFRGAPRHNQSVFRPYAPQPFPAFGNPGFIGAPYSQQYAPAVYGERQHPRDPYAMRPQYYDAPPRQDTRYSLHRPDEYRPQLYDSREIDAYTQPMRGSEAFTRQVVQLPPQPRLVRSNPATSSGFSYGSVPDNSHSCSYAAFSPAQYPSMPRLQSSGRSSTGQSDDAARRSSALSSAAHDDINQNWGDGKPAVETRPAPARRSTKRRKVE